MMEDAAVLSVLSKCFAPVEEGEWQRIASDAMWPGFLDGIRRLLQDDRDLGRQVSPMGSVHQRCPLQEFLSAEEVNALFRPPTHEEKRSFAARHFTGGLPQSAVPVESLYATWSKEPGAHSPFPQAEGLYLSDAARYMRQLIESMGMEVPEEFSSCPDHLSIELDLAAVMLRSGLRKEAQRFLVERLQWLTAYRMRLLQLADDDATFYIGLVDVLMGVCAQQAECMAAGGGA